ncbi:hypothetical protein [Cupriavidus sp. USMAA2-4]|uniref:hypothetical protein n=1 Tax=Cupriavidus sp. USMAA2-4 TaxID=876364 RepID=UPI0012F513F3|nr:hypothetical protein [Cupriavidus sp. USMAA2-4]
MTKRASIRTEILVTPADGPLYDRLSELPGHAGSRERAKYLKALLMRGLYAGEVAQVHRQSPPLSVVAPPVSSDTVKRHTF